MGGRRPHNKAIILPKYPDHIAMAIHKCPDVSSVLRNHFRKAYQHRCIQSSALFSFVRGIHTWETASITSTVMWKTFPRHEVRLLYVHDFPILFHHSAKCCVGHVIFHVVIPSRGNIWNMIFAMWFNNADMHVIGHMIQNCRYRVGAWPCSYSTHNWPKGCNFELTPRRGYVWPWHCLRICMMQESCIYHTRPCAYQWFQGCACKVCETHRLKVK